MLALGEIPHQRGGAVDPAGRYTLRFFLLCCALYALYTIGFYLLFRDRLFYSLFIARSLML